MNSFSYFVSFDSNVPRTGIPRTDTTQLFSLFEFVLRLML